jgi:hypothetical protein
VLRQGSSDSFYQAVEGKKLNAAAIVLTREGWARIGGDDEELGLGVGASKNQQAGRLEIASRPFAFDGQRGLASGQPDEVNLMALLVPPVPQSGRLHSARSSG